MPKKKQKKFYSVRNGREVGVYESWAKCKEQVEGYPDADYKSFTSKDAALEYIGITVVKATAIITAGCKLAGGGSGWAYNVIESGKVTDSAGDSETYKESAEMESVAIYQALRANQYLANEDGNVILVVDSYEVRDYLNHKESYLPVPDIYVKKEIDKLLKIFKNLKVSSYQEYRNHKRVAAVEREAERYAQEAVIF